LSSGRNASPAAELPANSIVRVVVGAVIRDQQRATAVLCHRSRPRPNARVRDSDLVPRRWAPSRWWCCCHVPIDTDAAFMLTPRWCPTARALAQTGSTKAPTSATEKTGEVVALRYLPAVPARVGRPGPSWSHHSQLSGRVRSCAVVDAVLGRTCRRLA
jgi:hypothetical protein